MSNGFHFLAFALFRVNDKFQQDYTSPMC